MSPQTPSPEKSGQGNGSPVQGAETLARDADSVPPVASPAEFVFAQGSAVFKGVTSACLSPSTYHYAPLPEDCIRLLWLMPHENKDAPIQCQLFDYLLLGSRGGTHLYEALSYVWGSPEKTQSIFTPTGCVPVTENLHAALSRLRDGSLPRIVWADAVCINQDDMEERDRQVKAMAKIYAKASRVIVWLEETPAGGHGDAPSDGDLALEEIRRAAAGSGSVQSSANRSSHKAVLHLLQRSWFRRIWVLQEVAAARHVLIMCHSTEIEGHAFCSGLKHLDLSEAPAVQSRIKSAVYLIKDAVFRPKAVVSSSDRFSLGIASLGELVDMYHNREATDRRDKVYALLGMSSDVTIRADLMPDYKASWKDLFYRLVRSLVGEVASVETWDNKEIATIRSDVYVWKAAAGNTGSAKAVLPLLLDLTGERIPHDKKLLEVAVGTGRDVFDLLTSRERLETHSQSFIEDITIARLLYQTDRLIIRMSQWEGLESHLKSDFEKLYDAAKYGNSECIEELISQGVRTATPGDRGQTALWIAARHGHEEIVELLARLPDTNTNGKPRSEQPAIFWSSWWGHERAVMALIDGGAYVGSMDKSRDTIVEMARARGHESIAQILESSQSTSVLPKGSYFWVKPCR
ncbi:hypothetical protein CEP52_007197 [Fusarium oligoseptatum]|uniref:Heterokaryon incompatibility domain-containing protein n=1 Tax=Fusarium oligoseptatum TaxID=2604345 RepID=A0A428TP48_9HYPO|nr:hypothetical protein CEP52_007197 [Fusarium oligoseptatum]